MAIAGPLTSVSTGRTAELEPQFYRSLVKKHNDRTVFLTLLMGKTIRDNLSPIKQEPVYTEGIFRWIENERIPITTTVATGATAAGLTFTVADYTIFRQGDIIEVIKNGADGVGEQMRITAKPATTTITVQARGMFGTTADVINIGATIMRLNANVPEFGITSHGPIEGNRSVLTGCCEGFRREIEESFRRQCARTYVGYDWLVEKSEALADLKEEVERKFLFGHDADPTITATDIVGTPRLYSSAGLQMLTTNRFDAGGNLNYELFCEYLGTMQERNSANDQVWAALCPQRVMRHIGLWGMSADYYQTRPYDKELGFNISNLLLMGTKQARIPLFYVPTLDTGIMDNGMYIVSLPHLTLMYMSGGPGSPKSNWNIRLVDAETHRDITPEGSTTVRLAWEAMVGLRVQKEYAHGIITNITS